MKTILYITLCLCVAISACKKHDQPVIGIHGHLKAFQRATDTVYFTYNYKGLVSNIYTSFIPNNKYGPYPRMHYAVSLVYDNTNRIQYVYPDSEAKGSPTYIFNYNSIGDIVRIDMGPPSTLATRSTYNNFHQLVTETEDDNGSVIFQCHYFYSNNNINSNISYILFFTPDTSYSGFINDNKKSYIATLTGIDGYISLIVPYPGLFHYYKTENNIIAETDSANYHPSFTTSYLYQYNSNDLPVKIMKYQSGVLVDSATLVYY